MISLSHRSSEENEAPQTASADFIGKKILLAEDDEMNQMFAEASLAELLN